ncbi:MAG: hypothetical protein ACREKR_06795 [Candidatus Methylomirabilales bacterium]
MDTLAAFSVIALLAVITMVPAIIVRNKTDKVVWWWLATVCTGFFPGLVAAILYRYRQTPPVAAFFWGIITSIGIGILIAYLVGAL